MAFFYPARASAASFGAGGCRRGRSRRSLIWQQAVSWTRPFSRPQSIRSASEGKSKRRRRSKTSRLSEISRATSFGIHSPFDSGVQRVEPVVFAHQRQFVRELEFHIIRLRAFLGNIFARPKRQAFRLTFKAQFGQ